MKSKLDEEKRRKGEKITPYNTLIKQDFTEKC